MVKFEFGGEIGCGRINVVKFEFGVVENSVVKFDVVKLVVVEFGGEIGVVKFDVVKLVW